MKSEFRIVMVEDVAADAELVERQLHEAGLSLGNA